MFRQTQILHSPGRRSCADGRTFNTLLLALVRKLFIFLQRHTAHFAFFFHNFRFRLNLFCRCRHDPERHITNEALFLSNSWEYGVEETNRQSRSTIWQAIWQILHSDWLCGLPLLSFGQLKAHGPNMFEVFEGQYGVTTNRTVLPGIEKVINRQIITQNTNCHQVATTKFKS